MGRRNAAGGGSGAGRSGAAGQSVARVVAGFAALSLGIFEGCGGTEAASEGAAFGRDGDYAAAPEARPTTLGERLGRAARVKVVEREGMDALRTSFVTDRADILRIVHLVGASHPIARGGCEPCKPELTLSFEDEGGSPLGSLALFCAGHGVEKPTRASFTMPPSSECAELTVREPDALRAALEPEGNEMEARPKSGPELDPEDGLDGPDPMPADALPEPAPIAGGCRAPSDCAASEQCRGPEGCGEAWTCVPAGICTRDLVEYCGCDGKTFRASSTCPGRPFLKRGRCPTVAQLLP